ncbi:beta transducin [Fusarium albosuccineum]|uniref:Beta transducin n=1 Tax=Fusarium albosuccineum TaxID=1237068 RepID=A0A8H4P844_9HYPO|nr:beta transducin [Fusarium albosuccineum]
MWLINTETLQLEEFVTPPSNYAILPHTWEKDEVLFRDMGDVSHASSKAGWKKIELTCEEARRSSIPYAWVDTCCIDKRSSAELSEAINSMFMWYKQASVCYAYLSDLSVDWDANESLSISHRKLTAAAKERFKKKMWSCRWFTRGWALQELIAPDRVVFFDQDWNLVGTKSDWDFVRILAEITGISVKVLVYEPCFHEASFAQKMSWAAKRQTTKVEDLAYCLLGIFNVNMPLLYGEGNKAFLRLQEEIAKEYHDLSLFAWKQDPEKQDQLRGLFASSPAEFAHCSELQERDWSF